MDKTEGVELAEAVAKGTVLYGVMVRAKAGTFWQAEARWYETRAEAEAWVHEAWAGTGCACRVVALPALEASR